MARSLGGGWAVRRIREASVAEWGDEKFQKKTTIGGYFYISGVQTAQEKEKVMTTWETQDEKL